MTPTYIELTWCSPRSESKVEALCSSRAGYYRSEHMLEYWTLRMAVNHLQKLNYVDAVGCFPREPLRLEHTFTVGVFALPLSNKPMPRAVASPKYPGLEHNNK